jgi:hypothetical protein
LRTPIPVTELSRAGVAPPAQTDSDQTNGMVIAANSGRLWVEIESTDAADQTVGFAIPITVDGDTVADKLVDVPAGATRLVGIFPPAIYNQDDRSLNVNPSVDTTLKFRAYKLPSS